MQSISNGTDKGELLETVVQLETELRATLTKNKRFCSNGLKKRMQKFLTGTSCRHSQSDFDWQLG